VTDLPYDLLMRIQEGAMAYQYQGRPLLKNPFDLAIYPLLLDRLRPRSLIEIGSHRGGSALWFADQVADLRVWSIDLEPPTDALTVDAAQPVGTLVETIRAALGLG